MAVAAALRRKSMPRRLRAVRRRFAMSRSKPGSTSRINSTTVTFAPNVLNTVANSKPITPPPIMARLSGRVVSESNSVEVTTPSRSAPGIGKGRGREPVAMMT